MPTVYLVRHAKPAATWGEAVDPGLDDLGRTQAASTAQRLHQACAPLPIVTSPLKRCRETAEQLSKLWNCDVLVMPAVAEVPSPPLSLTEKQKWLHAAMQGTWSELQASAPAGSPDYLAWRQELLRTLAALEHDCAIFTHYIAINVAVGAAQGHDRVLSFRPSHASVTTLDIAAGRIAIRELGTEADGDVLMGK